MNYDSLVKQIIVYANRTDDYFKENIPYFISLAHERIWREAKSIGFQKQANIIFKAKNPFVEKPSQWNLTISVRYDTKEYGENYFLLPRSYEFCESYMSDDGEGDPLFYCDAPSDGDYITGFKRIFVSPVSSEQKQGVLTYLVRPAIITQDSQENWLTERGADLLFYACMLEAFIFTNNPERLPMLEAKYSQALNTINSQTLERHDDATATRNMI